MTNPLRRKALLAAASIPALTLAGFGVAGAQSDDTDTDTGDGENVERHRHGPGRHVGGRIADALGIDKNELREALSEEGATIASVAGDLGVDIDAVIDDLVADAVEHAAERDKEIDEAELTERLTEMVNSDPADLGRHRGGRIGLRGGSEVIEEFLTMTDEEIRAELQAGSTIADLVDAQGLDLEDLVSQIVDDIEERVSERDGFDAEQFAEREDELTERITDRLNGERPEGRRDHGRRGPGRGFGPGPSADEPAESTAAAV